MEDETPMYMTLNKPDEMHAVVVIHKQQLNVRQRNAPHQGAPGHNAVDDDGEPVLPNRALRRRGKDKGKGKDKNKPVWEATARYEAS